MRDPRPQTIETWSREVSDVSKATRGGGGIRRQGKGAPPLWLRGPGALRIHALWTLLSKDRRQGVRACV